MNEPSLHTIAGWAFVAGAAFLPICAVLWRGMDGGVMAAYILPSFLGSSVMIMVIAGGIWWATRDQEPSPLESFPAPRSENRAQQDETVRSTTRAVVVTDMNFKINPVIRRAPPVVDRLLFDILL